MYKEEQLRSLTPEQLRIKLNLLDHIIANAQPKDLPYLAWVDPTRQQIYKILEGEVY